ncbi:MAG: GTP cyclohydrolase MptA [Candidatus Bathyarchaeia archaeon]
MGGLDVQDAEPEAAIPLRKVGAVGIKMPIGFISIDNKPVTVIPTFNVFIDLPARQKGIHASRSYEVISETMAGYVGKTFKLENLCASVATELLKRHRYASRSEVRGRGEAIFERRAPKSRMTSYESCDIIATAVAWRKPDGEADVERKIEVGVTGVTACPCAQEILRDEARMEILKSTRLRGQVVDRLMAHIPVATHMQRAYGTIRMDLPEGFEVDAIRFVQVIEDSMSASTFELLKRPDEVEVVRLAASHPRFAEDCIRYMMRNIAKRFPQLPGDVRLVFTVRSKESIHKHDFFAQRAITLGEIREELNR